MAAELLVLLVPILVLGSLAILEARHRAKRRLPMWRAIASVARSLSLGLRESRTAAYGVPEAFGRISDRPIDIRVAPGKSAVPIRTVISVGHRFPVRADVYFARSTVSKWVVGFPGWKNILLGDSPEGAQVRVTGREPAEIERFIALFGAAETHHLINLMANRSVYVGALRTQRLDVQIAGLESDRDSLNSTVQGLLQLANMLEARIPIGELRSIPETVEPRTTILPPRTLDSGLMVVVLILAGILAALPLIPGEGGNSATLEAYVFLWSIAGILVLIAGSRLASAHLGPAERQILAEFRNRHA